MPFLTFRKNCFFLISVRNKIEEYYNWLVLNVTNESTCELKNILIFKIPNALDKCDI